MAVAVSKEERVCLLSSRRTVRACSRWLVCRLGCFNSVLSSSQSLEKAFVCGHTSEGGAVFCKLPS